MSSHRVHLADGQRLLGHFIHEILTKILILILNIYILDLHSSNPERGRKDAFKDA